MSKLHSTTFGFKFAKLTIAIDCSINVCIERTVNNSGVDRAKNPQAVKSTSNNNYSRIICNATLTPCKYCCGSIFCSLCGYHRDLDICMQILLYCNYIYKVYKSEKRRKSGVLLTKKSFSTQCYATDFHFIHMYIKQK